MEISNCSNIPATLLLPVYNGDTAEQISDCLESLNIQSVLPSEILILVDGPISERANHAISRKYSNFNQKIYRSDSNIGLPSILNIGISIASHEYLFRMDADDICVRNRFKLQWEFFLENPKFDIIGGQIIEFDRKNKTKNHLRSVPLQHTQICKRLRSKNPFNHMTVFYKKSKIKEVGGYKLIKGFEDYDLWGRMISNGSYCHNLSEVLVHARTNSDFINRRTGLKYAINEIKFYFETSDWYSQYRPKFFTLVIRVIIRVMPHLIVKLAYRLNRSFK